MTPWPGVAMPGVATGVGSLPGTDVATAQARVFELLPDLPHLVELPARGPGADMVGRTAALLVDLAVDLQPSGWRFVPRPGHDLARSREFLARDLDALARAGDGWGGPLKVAAVGPWTLAATVELPRGGKAMADTSAVADIAASLADGLAVHLVQLAALLPGARLLVQLDEPVLPAVLAGRVPTASGFGVLRIPGEAEVAAVLATVLDRLPDGGVHCCAPDVPVSVLSGAGAGWLSVDATLLTPRNDDQLGTALEAGVGLMLGVADGDEGPAWELFRRLGLPATSWHAGTVLSPRCGLAELSPEQAWAVLRATSAAAARLAERVADAS